MEAGQRKAQRSWMLFLYSFACCQSSPAHYPGLGLLVRTPHSWAHVPLDLSELLLLILICGTVCYKQIGTYPWKHYTSQHSTVRLIIPPGVGGGGQIKLHLLAFLCTFFIITNLCISMPLHGLLSWPVTPHIHKSPRCLASKFLPNHYLLGKMNLCLESLPPFLAGLHISIIKPATCFRWLEGWRTREETRVLYSYGVYKLASEGIRNGITVATKDSSPVSQFALHLFSTRNHQGFPKWVDASLNCANISREKSLSALLPALWEKINQKSARSAIPSMKNNFSNYFSLTVVALCSF